MRQESPQVLAYWIECNMQGAWLKGQGSGLSISHVRDSRFEVGGLGRKPEDLKITGRADLGRHRQTQAPSASMLTTDRCTVLPATSPCRSFPCCLVRQLPTSSLGATGLTRTSRRGCIISISMPDRTIQTVQPTEHFWQLRDPCSTSTPLPSPPLPSLGVWSV